MNVYIVIGSEYEGSMVAGVFESKKDAQKLVDACYAYDNSTRPSEPAETLDTPENDAEWERFFKREARWRKRHPAGEWGHGYDSWVVRTEKLRPTARSTSEASAAAPSPTEAPDRINRKDPS